MNAFKKLLLTTATLGSLMPYRSTIHFGTTQTKPPKNNGKPTYKVVYYTDKNGKIRRTKIELGENNETI